MILDTIAQSARNRVEALKKQVPPEEMRRRALGMMTASGGDLVLDREGARPVGTYQNGAHPGYVQPERPKIVFPFEAALRKPGVTFICEVKKASPSKGVIADDFPYLDIAHSYEKAGADAISILTEPDYFLGSADYLREISSNVDVPILRKDFIVDEYQLYESKVIGSDAVLLICALLDTATLRRYIEICDELCLSALVEAHDEAEVRSALDAGARIIGVNNRDLKTFEVDLNNSVRLRPLIPRDVLFVAESGIKTSEDIDILRKAGVDAVLIGETLMRSPDKKAALNALRSGAK